MEVIYEMSESTPQEVPESLRNVIKNLLPGEEKDPVKLFFCLIYTLVIESGFSPVPEISDKRTEQSFYKSEIQLKNLSFDGRRVAYFSQNPPKFEFGSSGSTSMKFSFVNFKPIGVFLHVSRHKGSCLVVFEILVSGSLEAFTTVLEVERYIVNVEALNVADKFSNLKELSITVKSMLARGRTELLNQVGYCDKTCLENLPWHIQDSIKKYILSEKTREEKQQKDKMERQQQSRLLPPRNHGWDQYFPHVNNFLLGYPELQQEVGMAQLQMFQMGWRAGENWYPHPDP